MNGGNGQYPGFGQDGSDGVSMPEYSRKGYDHIVYYSCKTRGLFEDWYDCV